MPVATYIGPGMMPSSKRIRSLLDVGAEVIVDGRRVVYAWPRERVLAYVSGREAYFQKWIPVGDPSPWCRGDQTQETDQWD